MTTPVFDPDALQARIAAVQVAFDALKTLACERRVLP
jgi:hypothetical protein